MLRIVDGHAYLDSDIEPVEFWPYTTNVREVIFQTDYKAGDGYSKIQSDLLALFKEHGFICEPDNKIAFGVKTGDGKVYYIGFKDWRFSIGTSYRTDDWNLGRKQKKDQETDDKR